MDTTGSYDTEIDDFTLPTDFNNLVAAARSSVDTLRHLYYPAKNDRKREHQNVHATPTPVS